METISGTTWPVERARKYIVDRVHQVPWSGCWLWELALSRKGYGACSIPGRHGLHRVHRVAYEAFVGPIPDGMHVCHRCDVRACCNPDHLWLGTNADNVADMVSKGRNLGAPGESNGRAKLNPVDIAQIRAEYVGGTATQTVLAAKFGVSRRQIFRIVRGEQWDHV